VRSLLLAASLLAACDTHVAMEPRLRFELTRSEAHIDEAQRISRAGGDPSFPCTAVKQMIAGLEDETVQTVNETVVRGRKVCREVLLKHAGELVARMESRGGDLELAQHRARDCTGLSRALALVAALAKDDPVAAGLEKRRQILCR
jgi:hypothetical protein